jgi:hypothetical protein
MRVFVASISTGLLLVVLSSCGPSSTGPTAKSSSSPSLQSKVDTVSLTNDTSNSVQLKSCHNDIHCDSDSLSPQESSLKPGQTTNEEIPSGGQAAWRVTFEGGNQKCLTLKSDEPFADISQAADCGQIANAKRVLLENDTSDSVRLSTCNQDNGCQANSIDTSEEDLAPGETSDEDIPIGGKDTWLVSFQNGVNKCLSATSSDSIVYVSHARNCT